MRTLRCMPSVDEVSFWPEFATGSDLAVYELSECRSEALIHDPGMSQFVIGKSVTSCASARMDYAGSCGTDAALFEPHGQEPGI